MPGYKHSDVGVIPEDWKDVSLGEVAEIRMCKRIFAEQTNLIGDIPFFKIGTFGRTPDAFISGDLYREYRRKYSFPNKGDILLSAAGTLGKTVIFDGGDAYFQDSNIVWLDIDRRKIKNEYLYQCYQIIKWASPEGSTISRLYNGIIRNTKIPLPPTETEQYAIANALSDADALIGSLQKLIAKKRQIKQGAMQTLLNPYENGKLKTGWTVQKLGEMCEKITTGKLDANAMVTHGDYPFFTCAKEHYWIDKYAFDTEALLVSGNGANVGYIHYYNGKFNAYQRTYVLSGFSNHIHFLKLYMARNLQERIRIEVNAGNTPYIVMGTLTEMDVFLPIDVSEQIKIAKILSDMDSELEVLETKLAKYQQIKQGMMQNLLTGRIRLV